MYKIAAPDIFRKNVQTKIMPFVDNDDALSTNLEKAIYNYAIKEANNRKIIKKWDNPFFAQLYLDRLRSIYTNMKNPLLLAQLKNGDIKPQTLAFMTHQEMNPEHWRKLIEQKMTRDASKFTNNLQATTDMFTCKKCKSKRCNHYELQTRSADEPATIFITCLDCGKTWKM
uniref:TFIIS-type domain-containing protein n=1 Tax=viral metagenome TaxID=1070528 RepID=A0A6C0JGS0_9ZZZZ